MITPALTQSFKYHIFTFGGFLNRYIFETRGNARLRMHQLRALMVSGYTVLSTRVVEHINYKSKNEKKKQVSMLVACYGLPLNSHSNSLKYLKYHLGNQNAIW